MKTEQTSGHQRGGVGVGGVKQVKGIKEDIILAIK